MEDKFLYMYFAYYGQSLSIKSYPFSERQIYKQSDSPEDGQETNIMIYLQLEGEVTFLFIQFASLQYCLQIPLQGQEQTPKNEERKMELQLMVCDQHDTNKKAP